MPQPSAHEWYHYKAEEEIITSLMDSLCQRGYRESALYNQIKANFTKIIAKPTKSQLQQQQESETAESNKVEEKSSYCSIESFKEVCINVNFYPVNSPPVYHKYIEISDTILVS